jgi:hypothetical protein
MIILTLKFGQETQSQPTLMLMNNAEYFQVLNFCPISTCEFSIISAQLSDVVDIQVLLLFVWTGVLICGLRYCHLSQAKSDSIYSLQMIFFSLAIGSIASTCKLAT